MQAPGPATARFGRFRLNLQSGELWDGDGRTILPDQPLRILRILLLRRGALVTRDELRRELWADDTFVDFEHGLNAAIKRLRQVLGDSATAPRFIETIPRRGYRFMAAVESDEEPPVGQPLSIAPSDSDHDDHRRAELPSRLARSGRGASSRTVTTAAGVAAALLIGAAVALRSPAISPATSSAVPARGGRLVRLTSTPGLNTEPALSPDGSLVAYASDRAGRGDLDIWIQPIAGGVPTRITTTPGDEEEPSFSPDGAQIVYTHEETGGIYVVGELGGEPRLLVRAARAHTPRFSPDGKWIAYWTGLPVGISRAAGASGSVFVVPATGGSPRALLADFATARHPVWSPDGRHLLVLGARDDTDVELDWYLVPLEGGDPVIATGAFEALREAGAASAQERPIPAAWTARGDAVVTATTAHASSNIWQVAVSAVTGQVTGAPQRLTFGTAIERDPSVAAGRVVFSSLAENVDIWRLPLDPSSGLAAGGLERVTENPAVDQMMNVAADGRTLAFVSSRTGRNEVWLKDLVSRDERQITWSGVTVARLSPDGAKAVLWGFGPGKTGVELLNVSDGSRSRLCEDCERAFGWAPDGARVILAKAKPSRLFVHDFATGRQALLAGHPTWLLREARFSPDGRWVTFYTANSPDQRQVHIVPSDPASAVPPDQWLTVVNDRGSRPDWSADGSRLYYVSERDGAMCLWMQPLDVVTRRASGAAQVVQHLHDPRLRAGSAAIATSDVQGGYLYVTLTETTGNVWMLDGVDPNH